MYYYDVFAVMSGGVSGLRWVSRANYTFGIWIIPFAPSKLLVLYGTLGGGFSGYHRWVGRGFESKTLAGGGPSAMGRKERGWLSLVVRLKAGVSCVWLAKYEDVSLVN